MSKEKLMDDNTLDEYDQRNDFKEKALEKDSNFSEDLDNCSTYSQVLDAIDKKEDKRLLQPREFYEGRRGARKRMFFIC